MLLLVLLIVLRLALIALLAGTMQAFGLLATLMAPLAIKVFSEGPRLLSP